MNEENCKQNKERQKQVLFFPRLPVSFKVQVVALSFWKVGNRFKFKNIGGIGVY